MALLFTFGELTGCLEYTSCKMENVTYCIGTDVGESIDTGLLG